MLGGEGELFLPETKSVTGPGWRNEMIVTREDSEERERSQVTGVLGVLPGQSSGSNTFSSNL